MSDSIKYAQEIAENRLGIPKENSFAFVTGLIEWRMRGYMPKMLPKKYMKIHGSTADMRISVETYYRIMLVITNITQGRVVEDF